MYRSGDGMGIRLDGASVFPGAVITPYYDSLLVKVIAHARNMESACAKMKRSLHEFRIRGVKTNIPFLLNLLKHETFLRGCVHTYFIEETPELYEFPVSRNRAQKLLSYLGEVLVNGPQTPLSTTLLPLESQPTIPKVTSPDGQGKLNC